MTIWQLLPPLTILAWLALGVGWRAAVQRRRFGGSGIALFRSRAPLALLRDAGFVLFPLALLADALAPAIAPRLAPMPLPWLAHRGCVAAGAALALGATVLMARSQLNMGASWRIGIDEPASPGLVTTGWYGISRNPIYLFMMAVLLGILLMLPNALTLALVAIAYVGVRIQVAREEAYLLRTYGDAFRRYAARVGRFLPWPC
jgi:protein-S-isoprenylcysteine O-methyltransferase Ste14